MKNFILITSMLFVVLVTLDGVMNEGHYRQNAWLNTKYEGQKVADGMSHAARSLFQ